MITIIRTTSKNKDFIALVAKLDAYLKITDGDDHDFYNQFNGIELLNNVVLLYENNQAIGCGSFKAYNTKTVEIKRMYLNPKKRGMGYAQKIIKELEVFAKEKGYIRCVLETGKRQIEAVKFYSKVGYQRIPNYEPYTQMENSVCFEKKL